MAEPGASIPGTGTPVLFSCHMDTVAPGRGVQPVVEGGVVRSSGDTVLGADDKSGIAAVMEALESLLESGKPHRPVELLFSVCEELGLKGAKYADYSRFASKEALVLDNDIPGLINHRAPANGTCTSGPGPAGPCGGLPRGGRSRPEGGGCRHRPDPLRRPGCRYGDERGQFPGPWPHQRGAGPGQL